VPTVNKLPGKRMSNITIDRDIEHKRGNTMFRQNAGPKKNIIIIISKTLWSV